jgi:glycolate dehydrogenase iron-sulfur subunit
MTAKGIFDPEALGTCISCGFCLPAAGTYAILRRAESQKVLADKITELAKLDLDFVVVVNPGCQRQMIKAMRRARLRTRVVHLAELAAMAHSRLVQP